MKNQSLSLICLLFLSVSCNNKGKKVEPVNIMNTSPELQKLQADADQSVIEIKEGARAIQEKIEAATVSSLKSKRKMSFSLMKAESITSPLKFEYAATYFALMDYQIQECTRNLDQTDLRALSLGQLFSEIESLLPKDYKKTLKKESKVSDYLDIKPSHFKDLLRGKKENYNLAALSILMDFKTAENKVSIYEIILESVSSISRQEVTNNPIVEMVRKNYTKAIFLLQLRHNALYDLALYKLGGININPAKGFKIKKTSLSINEIMMLLDGIKKADETYDYLSLYAIEPVQFRTRRKTLKAMKVKSKKKNPIAPKKLKLLVEISEHANNNY
jgi:hypothetical protein